MPTRLLVPLAVFFALSMVAGASAAHRSGAAAGPRTVAVLATGRRPEPAFADPARHHVYIGNESAGRVTVLDDRTHTAVKVITVGHEVEDLALDNRTGRLYVANRNSSTVSVIALGTLRVVATLHTNAPFGVAVDPPLHRLYTADSNNTVAVFDTATNRLVHTIAAPGAPQGIGVDVSTHRIFVALNKGAAVLVFDGRSYARLARIPVGALPVHPVRVSAVDHRVYVVSAGSSTLSVIDGQALRVIQTLRTGPHPEGLWLDAAAHRAYVSDEGDPGTDQNSGDTVSVLDLQRGRELARIKVLLGPDGVAFDSATSELYVCDESPARISIVKLPPELTGRP